MDAVLLARIQFAMTVGFHFIFPPLTIGLAWLIFIAETIGWRKNNEVYKNLGKFFGKLFAVTFAVGVATGIVMEFQFGTNWSEYSKYVGDIFGAPLAAEGIFAFFLESGFLGVYLFGRNRVAKWFHWFSSLMVAFGATLSAFWIIVANSWQQTPAGYTINNGRDELTDFWTAVFNPSSLIRYFHTVDASLITGAFFMAGICAYFLLKNKHAEVAKKGMKIALIVAFISSVLELFPLGHEHAKQVAHTQPEKFAAIEGLYTTQTGAPLVMFAVPFEKPPELKAPVEIPGMLSWMAFGDVNAKIKGIEEFPPDERPPLFITFVSFHNMVILGLFFIFISFIGIILMYKNKLWQNRKVLKILLYSVPLPFIASQLGWIAAEVGRQPWIVYRFLKTSDAVSVTVPAGNVFASLIIFFVVYLLIGILWLYIIIKKVKIVPEPLSEGKEAVL